MQLKGALNTYLFNEISVAFNGVDVLRFFPQDFSTKLHIFYKYKDIKKKEKICVMRVLLRFRYQSNKKYRVLMKTARENQSSYESINELYPTRVCRINGALYF